MKVHVIDHDQFERLLDLEQALYGDGSRWTEDQRRDYANLLNRLNAEIRDQAEDRPDLEPRPAA
jgi:hypothetical protein